MRTLELGLAIIATLGVVAGATASDRDLKPVGLRAAPTAPAGATGKLVLLRDNESRVEVDADGRVVAVTSNPALPAPVADALAANIRKIAFAPPMKDGHPVPGVTFVWQDACAAPVDGGYRMAVKLLGNGPSLVQRYAPHYPFDALRGHESATWKVEYDVATDGSVAMHSATRLDGSRRFSDQFTKAIKFWVEAQHFVPEQLAGAPVATRVTTQVEFSLGGPTRTERKPDANPSCQVALAGPPAKDRRVALDSPFHPLAVD